MRPILALILCSATLINLGAPAQAAIVVSSFETSGFRAGASAVTDSSPALRKTLTPVGERGALLHACCDGEAASGLAPPAADFDPLASPGAAHPPRGLSVTPSGNAAYLNTSGNVTTPGTEPYAMLLAGLGLLGFAVWLHKSVNKERGSSSPG